MSVQLWEKIPEKTIALLKITRSLKDFRVTTGDLSGGEKKVYRRDRIREVLRSAFGQKAVLGQSFFLLGGPVRIRLRAPGLLKNRLPWDGHAKNRPLWDDHEKNPLSADRG
jgi:hypothetical protein